MYWMWTIARAAIKDSWNEVKNKTESSLKHVIKYLTNMLWILICINFFELQVFDNAEPLGYEKIDEVRTEWAKYFFQYKN